MSEFRLVPGFEEAWRAPFARRRTPEEVLSAKGGSGARARLVRLVRRTQEVMVKVTGRTRDPAHLKAHLHYISRKGELDLEGRDGWPVKGRQEVRELAEDWSAMALADSHRRANSPISVSLVLSMPAGTDPFVVRDAAGGFAAASFGDRFEYVFALHTDTPRPHVHIAVQSRGANGERLNPKKADFQAWRETFARELRERGVEAEATPRRARGVTRKAEKPAIRRIRQRAEAGRGASGLVRRAAMQDAGRAAFGLDTELKPWERQLTSRQQKVRALYLAQPRLLQGSPDAENRALGREVERFVREMPAPDTQRLALARELRSANARAREDRDAGPTRQR